MKEKVQSILSREERVSSCTLSTGLPGRCIVVAIPCGRHAWADHHTRFHSQSHSPTKSYMCRTTFFGSGRSVIISVPIVVNRHCLMSCLSAIFILHFAQEVPLIIGGL